MFLSFIRALYRLVLTLWLQNFAIIAFLPFFRRSWCDISMSLGATWTSSAAAILSTASSVDA